MDNFNDMITFLRGQGVKSLHLELFPLEPSGKPVMLPLSTEELVQRAERLSQSAPLESKLCTCADRAEKVATAFSESAQVSPEAVAEARARLAEKPVAPLGGKTPQQIEAEAEAIRAKPETPAAKPDEVKEPPKTEKEPPKEEKAPKASSKKIKDIVKPSEPANEIPAKKLFDAFLKSSEQDSGNGPDLSLIDRMSHDDLLRVNNMFTLSLDQFTLGVDTDVPLEDLRKAIKECF